jgi:hypothetical protein
LRLPGKTHGENRPEFIRTPNVALMSVVGFTPAQIAMLEGIGLATSEVDRALAFDVGYQDAMRCNIRYADDASAAANVGEDGKPDTCHTCHVTFIDKVLADNFTSEFEGCVPEPYPADLIPLAETAEKKPGPRASGTAKSSAQRNREFHARKRAQKAQQQERRKES